MKLGCMYERCGFDTMLTDKWEFAHCVGSEVGRGGSRSTPVNQNRKGLLGLANLGNTCFMNSALQCLSHTHGLQKYFRFCSHTYAAKNNTGRQKLLHAMARWFEKDWSHDCRAAYHSPEDILESVRQLNPSFQEFAQQDSQEFLRCALDNMHEELRRQVADELCGTPIGDCPSYQSARSGDNDVRTSAHSSEQSQEKQTSATSESSASGMREWMKSERLCSNPQEPGKKEQQKEEVLPRFTSIVSDLFQCEIVSIVRCLECEHISRTVEFLYDISVPIPSPGEASSSSMGHDQSAPQVVSKLNSTSWSGMLSGSLGKVKSWLYDPGIDVVECLRKYCAPEHLTGRDKYHCERCMRKVDGDKRIMFKNLPEVLCIHVKRFHYENTWYNGTKNSKVVTFPVATPLDVAPFLEHRPPRPILYKLIGLVQHIGNMNGGHYIAYCQHKRRNHEWYEYDDIHVRRVTVEQVERAEAYVLFFQRLASEDCKRVRRDFKANRRAVDNSIRKYLSQLPGVSASDDEQVSDQEMLKRNASVVQNMFRAPPRELDIVFVPKHWYVRLTTMSHPGPLDNCTHLCPHRRLGSEMVTEPFTAISRVFWDQLVPKYGGGPSVEALETCTHCRAYLHAYNERKQAERKLINQYDTSALGGDQGDYWYLIDATWVNKWRRYMSDDHVADIAEAFVPGPVRNDRLFENGKVRSNLRLKLNFLGINARVWWVFMHVHGGGPVICRKELDIYSAEGCPQAELFPEDLRSEDSADFARRISYQFVDECHGDAALYEQKYDPAFPPLAIGGRESKQVNMHSQEDVEVEDSVDKRVNEQITQET